jgi:hypothetical protein
LDGMGSSKCLLATPTQILPPVVALNLFNIEHVKIRSNRANANDGQD